MDLQALLQDHQLYHSMFQQDYFITARSGGPTAYGQYKQALRELHKRYRGLKELYAARELLKVDIDELAESEPATRFELRRKDINLAQKVMQMEDLEHNIRDTEREFKRFYQQAMALKAQVGELTDERREQLDREMWQAKMQEMAALDLATTGRLGTNTYELIASAPLDMRREVLHMCANPATLVEWFENKDAIPLALPEVELDVKRLIGG